MKEGDNEPTYPRLLERTLFALRGFSSVGSSDIVNRVLAFRKVFGLFHITIGHHQLGGKGRG